MANPKIVVSLSREVNSDIIARWENAVHMIKHEGATAYFMTLIRAGMVRPDVVARLVHADLSGGEQPEKKRRARVAKGNYMLRLRVDPSFFMDVSVAWHSTQKRLRSHRFAGYLRAGMSLSPDELQMTLQAYDQNRSPSTARPATPAAVATVPGQVTEHITLTSGKGNAALLDNFLDEIK